MKKTLYLILVITYLLGIVYLIKPSPQTPDLSDSFRSTEPGDTYQHPEQKAFYTDKYRTQALNELQSQWSVLSLPFLDYRLNYPPEEVATLVREQLYSSYLEEIVHPLRESLFVNGWEPSNSPKYSYLPAEDRPTIITEGNLYNSKVTIRPVYSPIWIRLIVWTAIFPAGFLVYLSLKKSFLYV
jgi:hypothetical protein